MVEADLCGRLPVESVVFEKAMMWEIPGEAEEVLVHYVTVRGEVVFDSPANIVTGTR